MRTKKLKSETTDPTTMERKEFKKWSKLQNWKETKATGNPLLGFPAISKLVGDYVYEEDHQLYNLTTAPIKEAGARWGTGTRFEGMVLNGRDALSAISRVGPGKMVHGHETRCRATASRVVKFVDRNLHDIVLNWFLFHSDKSLLPVLNAGRLELWVLTKARQLLGTEELYREVRMEKMDPQTRSVLLASVEATLNDCEEDLESFYGHKAVTQDQDFPDGMTGNCLEITIFPEEGEVREVETWLSKLQGKVMSMLDELARVFESEDLESNSDWVPSLRRWARNAAPMSKDNHRSQKYYKTASVFPTAELAVPTKARFYQPREFPFHHPELFGELMGWLRPAEQELVKLAIGRTALGGYTDAFGFTQSLKDWRYAIVLDGCPGIGKSSFLHFLTTGLQHHGLRVGLNVNRIDAGFGFDVFARANAVLQDDMAAQDFLKLSNAGIVKSAISGGTITAERKGHDATECEATGVLWAGVNGLDAYTAGTADDGIKSRVIVCQTKRLTKPGADGPETSLNFRELCDRLYKEIRTSTEPRMEKLKAGWSVEEIVGCYLIACGIEAVQKAVESLGGISGAIEKLRTQAVRNLQAEQSLSIAADAAATLSASALNYLEVEGHITAERAQNIAHRLAAGKASIDLPQLSLPLCLATAWQTTWASEQEFTEKFQNHSGALANALTAGRFSPTATHLQMMRDGKNLSFCLGAGAGLPIEEKAVKILVGSVSTRDFFPTNLGKIREQYAESYRMVPARLDELKCDRITSAAEFDQLVRLACVNPSTQRPGISVEVAKAFLGLL